MFELSNLSQKFEILEAERNALMKALNGGVTSTTTLSGDSYEMMSRRDLHIHEFD